MDISCETLLFQATVVMPNGRTSSSMEEPFYIIAVPDPSVPKPSNEDLPKVNVEDHYKNDAKINVILSA